LFGTAGGYIFVAPRRSLLALLWVLLGTPGVSVSVGANSMTHMCELDFETRFKGTHGSVRHARLGAATVLEGEPYLGWTNGKEYCSHTLGWCASPLDRRPGPAPFAESFTLCRPSGVPWAGARRRATPAARWMTSHPPSRTAGRQTGGSPVWRQMYAGRMRVGSGCVWEGWGASRLGKHAISRTQVILSAEFPNDAHTKASCACTALTRPWRRRGAAARGCCCGSVAAASASVTEPAPRLLHACRPCWPSTRRC
jgi:hypothetical protein